jgi:hypothetical protein
MLDEISINNSNAIQRHSTKIATRKRKQHPNHQRPPFATILLMIIFSGWEWSAKKASLQNSGGCTSLVKTAVSEAETDRQTSRQIGRQTARQPDSQTARQPDSQTARQPDRQPGSQTARKPDSQTYRKTD